MTKDKDNLEKGEVSEDKGGGEVPTVTSVKTVPTTVTSTTTVGGLETATTAALSRAV